jgi:hypothetical protein
MRGTIRIIDPSEVERIRRVARGALVKADALGRIPTPLEDVARAAELSPPEELFDLGELPGGLREIARKLMGKIRGALDVREQTIYVDRTLSVVQQRFAHGHEIGHYAMPWQRDFYYADDDQNLRPETRVLFEAEANRFSAEVLFQLERFTEMASDYRLGLAAPIELAGLWETSRHATIRRYVEVNPRECALVILGKYPVPTHTGTCLKVLVAIDSGSFRERYGQIGSLVPELLAVDRWPAAADALSALQGDLDSPIGSGEITLPETKRGRRTFAYEVHSNSYSAFLMIFRRSRSPLGKRRRLIWTSSGA